MEALEERNIFKKLPFLFFLCSQTFIPEKMRFFKEMCTISQRTKSSILHHEALRYYAHLLAWLHRLLIQRPGPAIVRKNEESISASHRIEGRFRFLTGLNQTYILHFIETIEIEAGPWKWFLEAKERKNPSQRFSSFREVRRGDCEEWKCVYKIEISPGRTPIVTRIWDCHKEVASSNLGARRVGFPLLCQRSGLWKDNLCWLTT